MASHLHFLVRGMQWQKGALFTSGHDVIRRGAVQRFRPWSPLLFCKKIRSVDKKNGSSLVHQQISCTGWDGASTVSRSGRTFLEWETCSICAFVYGSACCQQKNIYFLHSLFDPENYQSDRTNLTHFYFLGLSSNLPTVHLLWR